MPALFALGLHGALVAAKDGLHTDDWLGAFLDDIYLVTTRERARQAFDEVAAAIREKSGIDVHLGKCRAWSAAGGAAPPGIAEIGPEVWRCGRAAAEDGLKVLGSPLGSEAFVEAFAAARREEEQVFLDRLEHVPDLQSAWLLLLHCAAARANHLLRLLPPTESRDYATSHDDALWGALCGLISQERLKDPTRPLAQRCRRLASLPGSMGGLGMRSAARGAHGAYWAAWVDALPVIGVRAPTLAARIVAALGDDAAELPPCLAEARDARARLEAEGMESVPTWEEAAAGARPECSTELVKEPGEWPHGWQYYSCRASDTSFLQHAFLPTVTRRHRALLHSQSGPLASRAFTALPTMPATRSRPERFQVLLRRRLWLRLPLAPRTCPGRSCKANLDHRGDHLAACARTGLLKRRSRPQERAWGQVLREAGARVVENQLLRDTGVPGIRPSDHRAIEVVAYDLPLFHGVPLCCDATLVSPLTGCGGPRDRSDEEPGAALCAARRKKHRTYPELLDGLHAKLLVLGCEVGGRWSQEAVTLLSLLAAVKAREAPPLLRGQLRGALMARWSAIVAVATLDAFAATLTGAWASGIPFPAEPTPAWGELVDRV